MPSFRQRSGGGGSGGFQAPYRAKFDETARHRPNTKGHERSYEEPAAEATGSKKRKRAHGDDDQDASGFSEREPKEDKYSVLATAALATMDPSNPKRGLLAAKAATHTTRKAEWKALSEEEKKSRAKQAKTSKRETASNDAARGPTTTPKGSKVERAVADADLATRTDAYLKGAFKEAELPSYLKSDEWLTAKQRGSLASALTDKVRAINRRTFAAQKLGMDLAGAQAKAQAAPVKVKASKA